MYFAPYNRHLVVDIIEEKSKPVGETVIVLPSDYEKPVLPYTRATVLEVAEDSKFHGILKANDTILLERRMLHKIELGETSFYLVLENYVFGRITE